MKNCVLSGRDHSIVPKSFLDNNKQIQIQKYIVASKFTVEIVRDPNHIELVTVKQ